MVAVVFPTIHPCKPQGTKNSHSGCKVAISLERKVQESFFSYALIINIEIDKKIPPGNFKPRTVSLKQLELLEPISYQKILDSTLIDDKLTTPDHKVLIYTIQFLK